jgi:hypothetical protein
MTKEQRQRLLGPNRLDQYGSLNDKYMEITEYYDKKSKRIRFPFEDFIDEAFKRCGITSSEQLAKIYRKEVKVSNE